MVPVLVVAMGGLRKEARRVSRKGVEEGDGTGGGGGGKNRTKRRIWGRKKEDQYKIMKITTLKRKK